jgi:hypothetical protein
MSSADFTIQNTNHIETREFTYYTIFGDHDRLDKDNNPILVMDSDKALAKRAIINDKTKFYIKIGAHGKIYNPMGMFSEGQANRFMSQSGKRAWEFREVNNKVFDMYLSFLKTKNIAWLNNAQREIS